MEQAKIQSDPFKEKFTFFCNGSKMTGKTDFQDYENSSLLDWADEISEKIGTAIYDDFNLSVCGEYFEKEFLEGIISVYASEDAAYKCISLRKENHNNHIDANDRLRSLQGLAEKYNISTEPFYKLQVFCKNKDFVESNAAYAAVDTPEKAFCIVDDDISAWLHTEKALRVLFSVRRKAIRLNVSEKMLTVKSNISGRCQQCEKLKYLTALLITSVSSNKLEQLQIKSVQLTRYLINRISFYLHHAFQLNRFIMQQISQNLKYVIHTNQKSICIQIKLQMSHFRWIQTIQLY